MRGYFGIGIYGCQKKENIGTLWRSACIFGASFIFTIGNKYQLQCSDTLKAYRHIPLYNYISWNNFISNIPYNTILIGVENRENTNLINFIHPERAIYILGSESNGLPDKVFQSTGNEIHIPTVKDYCLNVSTAGSIVMYDRYMKQQL